MEGERIGEEESGRKREAGGEKKEGKKRRGEGGREGGEKEHILGIGINMKYISGIAPAHGIMNNNLI